MTPLMLGNEPGYMQLHLPTGGDFKESGTLIDPATGEPVSWPAGTSLTLAFDSGATWPATVTGAVAAWAVDKAVADAISAGTVVKLVYASGSDDVVLYIGRVVRHG